MKVRKILFMALAAAFTAAPLAGFDEGMVKRSEPQREGRSWVEQVDCSSPAHSGGRLLLRADFGSVSVTQGPDDRVNCRLSLRVFKPSRDEALRFFERIQVSADRIDGDGLSVSEKRYPGGHERGEWSSAEFQFTVPKRFNLDMETHGGDVNVAGLDGELRAVTAGGHVRTTGDVSGPVHIETAGGNIELCNIGQRLIAQTAGGGIRVGNIHGDATMETSGGVISAGVIAGSVKADTSGGDIVLRGASGPVVAETAGGQIQIGQCGAGVRAETAGGSIHLNGAKGTVVVETAGGNIDLLNIEGAIRAVDTAGRILAEIQANGANFAASHLETSVGDIQVFIPPDLPLNVDAMIEEAMGHHILTDFPLRVINEGDQEMGQGPKRCEGQLNGGGKELRMRTGMGNIELRKINTQVLQQIRQRQEEFWRRWEEQQKLHKQKQDQSNSDQE